MLESIYNCVEVVDEPTFDLCLGYIERLKDYHEENDNPDRVFTILENTQPTKDFDDYVFICSKYFQHLKEEKIFINDKFYFDVLKNSGFKNVFRVYGGTEENKKAMSNVCNSIKKFNVSINLIDFKFQRLSNSRHDHNYYIMNMLTKHNLLKDILWSYSNGNKFYFNFNRFLGIKERDYEHFPEKSVRGNSYGPYMNYTDIENVQQCAIVINCESSYHGHGPCYSEKLVKCAVGGRPFIEVSTPGTLEDLHNMGIKTFPDLVDESYDRIICPHKRIEKICDEILKLSKFDHQYFKDYIVEHAEILENNFNIFQRLYNAYENKNIDGLILERTS